MANEAGSKDHVSIYLHDVHVRLLDELIPFYGGTRAEVIRFIVIDWLSRNGNGGKSEKGRGRK